MAVQDDRVFISQDGYDRERALQQARDMGVTRIRVNATWSALVTNPGDLTVPAMPIYNWSPIDSLVDAAARYGIRVQLTLTGPAPAWATQNHRISNFGPRAKLFGDFTRAVAKHFKGRVGRYSIWNEPNYISWLQPYDLNAALYRELYVAAYTQIKRADKTAQVLIGETAPYAIHKRSTAPLAFLRDVTCTTTRSKHSSGSGVDPTPPPPTNRVVAARVSENPPTLERGACKPLRADGFAHHPYDYRHKPDYAYKGVDNATLGSLGRLKGTLSALARLHVLQTPKGKSLPIYLTEYGYFASGKYRVADSARSAYLKQAFTIAQRDTTVRQLLQYGFVGSPTGKLGDFFDLTLIGADGTLSAAYHSLAGWARSYGSSGRIALPTNPIPLPAAPIGRRR